MNKQTVTTSINQTTKQQIYIIIMLNDNLIFLNPTHFPSRMSRPNRFYFAETSPYSCYQDDFDSVPDSDRRYDDAEEEDSYRQYYLAAIRAEEERRKYHDNVALQQAYMEAMERNRRQKLIEKERRRQQHLMEEAERRRREKEEQQRREKALEMQFMALLEHNRQEKIKTEKMRTQRAKALEELRRQEMMRRRVLNSCFDQHHHHHNNPVVGDEQLIQGLDGNIYRIRNHSSKSHDATNPNSMRQCEAEQRRWHQTENDCVDSLQKSIIKNILEKEDDKVTNDQKSKKNKESRKRKKRQAALLKSSILVGEVEDASDSECEEEYNDFWHNRRPQSGEWIEPIENATFNV